MIKFFYNLYFHYEDENGLGNTCNIGYFSTKKKAEKILEIYMKKPGFREYSNECFVIKKIGVNFSKAVNDKSKVVLYECGHDFFAKTDEEDEWIVFGTYSTRILAEQEIEKQKCKKKYKNHITGFSISKWRVDRDLEWQEGFEMETTSF